MTKEEYETLKEGDVVENQFNGTRKVILTSRYASEPITQIAKNGLIHTYQNWNIMLKKVVKEDEPN